MQCLLIIIFDSSMNGICDVRHLCDTRELCLRQMNSEEKWTQDRQILDLENTGKIPA